MKICSLCKHFPRFQFEIVLSFNRHQDHNFRFITNETIGNQSEHDLREINPTMPTVGSWRQPFLLTLPDSMGQWPVRKTRTVHVQRPW